MLILLKPTLTGDEPGDVLQYHTRNAAFPHESTGDQFYDEAQWESYRSLGRHVVVEALRAADRIDPEHRTPDAVFPRVRLDWWAVTWPKLPALLWLGVLGSAAAAAALGFGRRR